MIKTETKRPNPVKTLRLMGCKVRVYHERLYKFLVMGGVEINRAISLSHKGELLAKGGHTKVIVETPNGQKFEGVAECSTSESYCKKTGVALCLDRLKKVE